MERTDVSMLSNCAPSTSATVPQSVTTTVLALQDGNSPVRCSEPGKLQIHMSFGQGAALCLSGNGGVGGAHLWSTMVTSRRASSVPSRERFTLPSAPTWGPTFISCAQPERMKGLQYYRTAPWCSSSTCKCQASLTRVTMPSTSTSIFLPAYCARCSIPTYLSRTRILSPSPSGHASISDLHSAHSRLDGFSSNGFSASI